MKAVLVIDLKADELPKDAHANVYVFGKYYEEQEDDFIAHIQDIPLKPLPEKWNIDDDIDRGGDVDYAIGRNDVIDEITGDTE